MERALRQSSQPPLSPGPGSCRRRGAGPGPAGPCVGQQRRNRDLHQRRHRSQQPGPQRGMRSGPGSWHPPAATGEPGERTPGRARPSGLSGPPRVSGEPGAHPARWPGGSGPAGGGPRRRRAAAERDGRQQRNRCAPALGRHRGPLPAAGSAAARGCGPGRRPHPPCHRQAGHRLAQPQRPQVLWTQGGRGSAGAPGAQAGCPAPWRQPAGRPPGRHPAGAPGCGARRGAAAS